MSNYLFKHPVPPLNNINGEYVNTYSSHYPGNFGSNQTSLEYGLPALRDNISAANASRMAGGTKKRLRKKIKNIVNKYRMPKGKKSRRSMRSVKRKLLSLHKKSPKSRTRRTRKHKQRGGYYAQFSNNIPNTPSYSVGSNLSAKDLGLANPPPIQRLTNCTNCIDNYNYNTNKGFQLW
jgi:hypothetical protein